MLKPLHYRHHGRILFTQSLNQLHDESGGNELALGETIRDLGQERPEAGGRRFEELVGEFVSLFAFFTGLENQYTRAGASFPLRPDAG